MPYGDAKVAGEVRTPNAASICQMSFVSVSRARVKSGVFFVTAILPDRLPKST